MATAVREISRGYISTETCQLIDSLNRPIEPHTSKPVHLFATNYDADLCNDRHLKEFSGQERVFTAKDTNVSVGFQHVCSVGKNLKLKVGVPVILCQTLSRFLCNGRMGVVKQIGVDVISVMFDSQLHEIPHATFTFKGVLGKRVQFPLRLAFALTVHRAQGLTLNQVVVHCDKMTTPGQLGVALGRARNTSGLQVLSFRVNLIFNNTLKKLLNFMNLLSYPATAKT